MDLQRDAARLASIATVFVWVGWLSILYAFIAGILWWIDLASRNNINWLEAFAISAAAIGTPLFLALIVAGLGHFLRLFALYVRELRQVGAGRPHDPSSVPRARGRRAGLSACSSGPAADVRPPMDRWRAAGDDLDPPVLHDVDGTLTLVPMTSTPMPTSARGGSGDSPVVATRRRVYRTGGDTLLIGMPIMTLPSCGETADAFQTTFLTLLQQSAYYNVRGET